MGGPNPAQNSKDLQRELAAFKHFLDTRGQELSKTSEFLQYYALPYVQNPLTHPTFSAVCNKNWATDLRNKLKEFLMANVPKSTSPQIFHWYANFKKRAGLHVPENSAYGGGIDLQSPEMEDLKEKMLLL